MVLISLLINERLGKKIKRKFCNLPNFILKKKKQDRDRDGVSEYSCNQR